MEPPTPSTASPAGLRVLHIDTGPVWRGGQAQVFRLLREQVQAGLDVTLAAERGGELLRRAQAQGFTALPVNGREVDPAAVVRLARAAGPCPFAVVHSHSSHALLTAAAVQRWSGAPIHVHTRRVDFPIRRHPLSLWKYRRGCDHVIAISQGVRAVLLAAGVPGSRISVVHSGIDAGAVVQAVRGTQPRDAFGWPRPKLLAVTVAALTDHKGHAYLLEAYARLMPRHPELLAVFAGDGELRPQLERQAAELGLAGRIRFAGFRDDVPDLLASADLFVLPSHLEGLCTSLLDAMAFGLPIAATAVGGIPEAVVHGETGWLVPPRDPAALAAAIEHLLADGPLRQRMGDAGRLRVQQSFDIRATAAGTLDVYRRLLSA